MMNPPQQPPVLNVLMKATSQVETYDLPGRGRHLFVMQLAEGLSQFKIYEHHHKGLIYYGDGVTLRIQQHGTHFTAKTVSTTGNHEVQMAYSYSPS